MKNKPSNLYTSDPSSITYDVLPVGQIEVRVHDNPLQLSLQPFLSMAARLNKKRSFLFVSHLLGKHIAIHPAQSLLAGTLLAKLLFEGSSPILLELSRGLYDAEQAQANYETLMMSRHRPAMPLIVIGFAETATALGHTFFDAIEDRAFFFHTTRENLHDFESQLHFEEEHSHATQHRCYLDSTDDLMNDYPIILVDDELTTGKTVLNFIRNIQKSFPRKQYFVASLLDWRDEVARQTFQQVEQELDIRIDTCALMSGSFTVCPKTPAPIKVLHIEVPGEYVQFSSSAGDGTQNDSPFLRAAGRFGLTSEARVETERVVTFVAEKIHPLLAGTNTLCLGTGEFMYVPMRIAAKLGNTVKFHTTTRSPIYTLNEESYPIRSSLTFPSPDDATISNYVYNIEVGQYDQLIVFFERDIAPSNLLPIMEELRSKRCESIIFVFLCKPVHDWSEWV